MIQFDREKDESNVAKHGISLARAGDMEILARLDDDRFSEPRFRAYGLIDGRMFCLAYVVRAGMVRAISLRPTRAKEFRRYVA